MFCYPRLFGRTELIDFRQLAHLIVEAGKTVISRQAGRLEIQVSADVVLSPKIYRLET